MRKQVCVLALCACACGGTGSANPGDASSVQDAREDGTHDATTGESGNLDSEAPPDSADQATGPAEAGDAGSDAWPGDAAPSDAAPGDTAPGDAAPGDAWPDGTPADGEAGSGVDAAPVPTICPQAGAADAGSLDVWMDALGSHTLADRGRILGCVHLSSYSVADVAASSYFGQGSPSNGYELYIVQYVSEGSPGVPKSVTALLYLPSGVGGRVPIAAVDHPTSGMGPGCGATHTPAITDNIAVPLVGRGYAVVATDYAGMGVDNGMTSYLVGASEAAATLDGVRALRAFHETRFDAAQLSTDFFVVGHSQGGHAALFTHALFDAGVGVNLLGSVSFAPGLGNAKDWSQSFDNPSRAVGYFDAFTTMSLYSHMLYAGGPDASTWLTSAAQITLPPVFHDECSMVASSLVSLYPTQGDLFTASFTSGAMGCAFTAPCAGFEPWSTELIAEEPGNFTSTVPALVLQGTADTVVLPAQTMCILNRLAAHGTPFQGCAYSGLDHTSVVAGALPDAIAWMAARRTGQTPAACATNITGTCTLPN